MATINQLVRKPRKTKVLKSDVPALKNSTQRKGVCTRVYKKTPKKTTSEIKKYSEINFRNALKNIFFNSK